MRHPSLLIFTAIVVSCLSACGGSTDTSPAPTYSIGGSISGIPAGGAVKLADNGADSLQLGANGPFAFSTQLTAASPYDVTVLSATPSPNLSCTVTNAAGTVASANVSSVLISCQSAPAKFTIGGTIIGLPAGASVTLVDNASDKLTVTSNGSFTFASTIAAGGDYSVTVAAATGVAPTCALAGASGTASANVTSIAILCKGAQFAYVASGSGDTISGYYITPDTAKVGAGGLNPIAGAPAATGTYPISLAVTPAGKFLYAANENSQNVSGYSINLATGSLVPIPGSPFASGAYPSAVAVDPTGSFVYVANNSNSVGAYSIDPSTGALTQLPNSPYAAGNGPFSIAINAAGSALYVGNLNDATVSAFNVDASTGALTQIGGSPFPTGGMFTYNIKVNPAGTYIYLASYDDSTIRILEVEPGTGALTPTPASPLSVPNQYPHDITLNPVGTYAYTANNSHYTVSGYSVDATTGNLTPVPESPYVFPGTPIAVTINPTGTTLYTVLTTNQAAAYHIDPATGSLTAIGTLVATGSSPQAIVTTQAP